MQHSCPGRCVCLWLMEQKVWGLPKVLKGTAISHVLAVCFKCWNYDFIDRLVDQQKKRSRNLHKTNSLKQRRRTEKEGSVRQLDSCVLAAPMLCQLSVKSAKPLLNKTVVKPLLLPTNVIDFLADRAVSSPAGETLWVSWNFITELSAGSTLSLSLNVSNIQRHRNLIFFLVLQCDYSTSAHSNDDAKILYCVDLYVGKMSLCTALSFIWYKNLLLPNSIPNICTQLQVFAAQFTFFYNW